MKSTNIRKHSRLANAQMEGKYVANKALTLIGLPLKRLLFVMPLLHEDGPIQQLSN